MALSENELTCADVRANCALGDKCRCEARAEPWLCKNWGRSSLSAPHIHSAYKSPLDKVRSHNAEQNKRLRDIRHSNPVKHLAKKGVKV